MRRGTCSTSSRKWRSSRPGMWGEDLCNFNQLEDYIIHTKDSLEAGATFLKAAGEVYSWRQYLKVCCIE